MRLPALLCLTLLVISIADAYSAEKLSVCHLVAPGYPAVGWMARIQGSVRLSVEIDSEGKVSSVKVLNGNTVLADASQRNVRQWMFCPAPAHATIAYVYKLRGTETYPEPTPKVVMDLPYRIEVTSAPPKPMPSTGNSK
jgi:TonB family protein